MWQFDNLLFSIEITNFNEEHDNIRFKYQILYGRFLRLIEYLYGNDIHMEFLPYMDV
jgi:hypothetical protein